MQADIAEADAWWSGDETRLAGLYGGVGNVDTRSRWAKFWSRAPSTDGITRGARLHVPAASDVATTAADLLFGDTPTWTIPGADDDTDDPAAIDTQARLSEILDASDWASTLLEAAEVASGLGGVYLRPTWDLNTTPDRPILTVMHSDQAVPEFRFGELAAVTFWRIIETDKGVVWRHLERHSPGLIEHGLYRGKSQALGKRYALDTLTETASLAGPDGTGVVDLASLLGVTSLDCAYVPNVRPNRKHRTVPIGRSDCAGTEALMDALDETWTSWVRDIRLGKARIIVPHSMLEHTGRGEGATFDTDREVFTPLEVDPAQAKDAGITPVEFALRVAEHEATARALFTQIVQTAGYSPQSFGLPGNGAAQTATEVDARTDRSTRTTNRKRGYWRRALQHVAYVTLAVDAAVIGTDVVPIYPTVEFGGGADDDLRSTAETLNLLAMAKAASVDTRVRMLHPEWGEEQIAAEVARITAEDGIPVDDPLGGM